MHIYKKCFIILAWLWFTIPLLAQTKPVPPTVLHDQAPQADGNSSLAQELDHVRALLKIQQNEIENLKSLAEATATQLAEQPPPSNSEQLSEEIERLNAATRRSAKRDEEVAYEIDRLTEDLDAVTRDGPQLPSNLREVFLPSRFDQSPIVMYNTLQTGFKAIEGEKSSFGTPTWLPHFYMLFREDFQLQINPQINAESFELLSGQIDWFLRDDLTVSVGRFYSPLGFFNDRLHTSWVVKTPDDPMVFEVVYPHQLSMNGLQLRGAKYVSDLPVKLEYCGFAANGFSLDRENPTAKELADFRLMRKSFRDVNADKAFGGRLGLSFPQIGLVFGASGMLNGAYDPAGDYGLSLIDYDVSLHNGNWDFKFEYANVSQQTRLGHIDRQGFYFQTAYRNYQNIHSVWGNLEYVFRFGHVDFNGIDLGVTGLDFDGSEHIPIDRNRYTIGTNYYFSPSLIAKLAYNFNDELSHSEINDNGFLAQVTWGF